MLCLIGWVGSYSCSSLDWAVGSVPKLGGVSGCPGPVCLTREFKRLVKILGVACLVCAGPWVRF